MKPLSVVAYFDGRLGHEKQTSGILHALADITPLEVVQNRVSTSPVSFCKNWASYLLSSLHQPAEGGSSSPVDLIIGTGSHTHIPMLLEKKLLQKKTGLPVPVVTCMTPNPQLFKKIDLCIVPIHDEVPAAENIFTTLGPPNTVRFGKAHQHDRGLILIGGIDKKSHAWKTEAIVQQVKTIINREKDIQWTISSSPRTPEDTCRMLEEITTTRQRTDFFRSADTPAGWVEKEYARNTIVWVTADSISMVYEALTAGCSVGILPVDWTRHDNKFQKSLSILHNRKVTVTYSDWLAGAGMPEPPEEPFNEAGRCAKEILRRWWPDRLSRF